MRMKIILCYFFGLIVGTRGVYAQLRLDTLTSPMKKALGWKELPQAILTIKAGPPVRIMQPDHMSCVIANSAFLQPMPVRRMKSTDPMPNGVQVVGQHPGGGQMPVWEGP